MTHRGEMLLLDFIDLDAELGEFESATEARTTCAQHKGTILSCSQPWEGLREAEGREYWYQAVAEI